MTVKYLPAFILCLALMGCGKAEPPKQVVVVINDYEVSQEEFEQGFAQSPYAVREDRGKARGEYLDNLINQKLILQDAQKKNMDKDREFLKSIERFWEQSLLTIAVGTKTREISGSLQVPPDQIQKLYQQMVKEGLTTKSFEEMYPQIKWQAAKQFEAQALALWMDGLRREAKVKINDSLLKAAK
ncbi:MAG: hypothetical protein HGA80_04150 [Candidatus Omnitrophica bacterium]|nr:hypothetical protein [Candidatus Omnitrophota bacterium]